MTYELPPLIDKLSRTQQSLDKLLSTAGMRLERIVDLLDAGDYLIEVDGRGKQEDGLTFDAKTFLLDIIASGESPQLPEHYIETDAVILEPGEGEIQEGGKKREAVERATIPRTRNVMNLLGKMNEQYVLIDGKNRKNMVRRLSYVVFALRKANKFLFVNDEESNATYIVHGYEDNRDWKEYAAKTKDELRTIAAEHPELISVLEFRSGMEGFLAQLQLLIEHTPEKKVAEATPAAQEVKEEGKIERAPEGWMNKTGIASEIGKSASWIDKHIKRAIHDGDNEVKIYRDKINRPGTHYSPVVVERLRQLKPEGKQAPKGWLTKYGIIYKIKKSRDWVETRLASVDNATETEVYLDSTNRPKMHYSPAVVERLQKLAEEIKPAPDGWLVESAVADAIGKTVGWVRPRLEAAVHSEEEVGTYQDKIKRPGTHYSPVVVERLRKLANKIDSSLDPRLTNKTNIENIEVEKAPPGWMTISSISKKITKYEKWILARIEEVVLSEDEAKIYLDASVRQRMHYSPAVVERLQKLAEEITTPPPGWLNISGIVKAIGKHRRWIRKELKNVIQDPDSEAKEYIYAAGKTNLHYSPDVVERLRKLAEESK